MSRETERIFRGFHEFVGDKKLNEEQYEQALNEFMDIQNNMTNDREDDEWDYLDMAYDSDSEVDAIKYAKKALKMNKNCLDAEVLIADLTIGDLEKLKIVYERLIKKAEKYLKEQDTFDKENIGYFWGILETRPYMRLRSSYLKLIITMGKFRKAIDECEDLLTLSENDNLAIRYTLMALYALYEDESNALKLYKKYNEDSTQILLPIIAMYYKMDNYKKAKTYLKKLNAVNSELSEFFYNIDEYDEVEMQKIADARVYRPGSKEEIMITISESPYLYSFAMTFFFWIVQNLAK